MEDIQYLITIFVSVTIGKGDYMQANPITTTTNNYTPTSVTASYRLPTGPKKDKKRVFVVNIRAEAVAHLRLGDPKNKPRFVAMKATPTGYSMTFTDRPTARSLKVPAPKTNSVVIEFDDRFFRIAYDENVPAQLCDALMSSDGNTLLLNINIEQFLDQTPLLVTEVITTKADKVQAGFKEDSLWGEALDRDVDSQIKEMHEDYLLLRAKEIENKRRNKRGN